jgi:hypothetical protein
MRPPSIRFTPQSMHSTRMLRANLAAYALVRGVRCGRTTTSATDQGGIEEGLRGAVHGLGSLVTGVAGDVD